MPKEFSEWLRRAIDERGLSERAVSKYASLGKTTVHHIVNNPDSQPSTTTIRKLARYFREDEDYLLELAGHKSEDRPYGDKLLDEVTRLFRQLPPERKREELARLRLAVRLAEERAPYIVGGEEEGEDTT